MMATDSSQLAMDDAVRVQGLQTLADFDREA